MNCHNSRPLNQYHLTTRKESVIILYSKVRIRWNFCIIKMICYQTTWDESTQVHAKIFLVSPKCGNLKNLLCKNSVKLTVRVESMLQMFSRNFPGAKTFQVTTTVEKSSRKYDHVEMISFTAEFCSLLAMK